MPKNKVGRPRKKPDFDPEKNMQEMLDRAVALIEEPYDDRDLRDPGAPSISFVAKELQTTLLRTRKLLITAGYYSTALSRNVQTLSANGASIEEIMQKTGLHEASVYSYLPYSKCIYNLEERSLNADRTRTYKKRKQACEQLAEHLDQPDAVIYMWSAVLAFQEYPFRTPKGYPFKYHVENWEMFFSKQENTLDKATVEIAFKIARDVQKAEGYVSSHKKLASIGSSYLYPIFVRIGVCEQKPIRNGTNLIDKK